MKIYFSGSIRGGREKREDYEKIIEVLKQYGTVLTEHIGSKEIEIIEKHQTDEDIYLQDIEYMKNSDLFVAEVSVPSIGVGYELGYADALNKKMVCLYDNNSEKPLSAMISGNKNIEIMEYINIDELLKSKKFRNLFLKEREV